MSRRASIPVIISLIMLLIISCRESNPVVVIETSMGNIEAELFYDRAPVTTDNFLRYVNSSLYRNTSFYRTVRYDNQPHDSVRIEVIQGGRNENENNGFPPVRHETTSETGLRHLDGTVSMARDAPGSATSEFFICIGNQPSLDYGGLRNRDGQGFAAFGRVISGMETVRKIQSADAQGQYLIKPVIIFNITRK